VPLVAQRAPLDGWGDLLVVVGLLALARFVMAIAALDAGGAFGGMGSSREVAIATLVEPALVLALVGAALAAGSTDLGTIATRASAEGGAWLTPALLLAALAFALPETGHEPVDNPDTHLELTMVHEGMLLEASGRRLAILSYAAELRMVLVAAVFAAAFLPFGSAAEVAPLPILVGMATAAGKLVVAAVAFALLDATLAKLRILALPGLLAWCSRRDRPTAMNLDPHLATSIVDACASGVVLVGIGLAVTRSLGRAILLVALQSLLAGLAALAVGLGTGATHLVVGGALAMAVKGTLVPLLLGAILRRSALRTERHPYLGPRVSLLAAVAIVFAAALASEGVRVASALGAERVLPAAMAEVLTGLFIAMTRRQALSIVIGLLVFETGIALTAFALTYGMPLVVELGILFDLLIAVVVAWVFARRMIEVLGTMSTDRLRSLRG
jgi:hydrogenase-4 membrane subunit HyfE